MSFDDKYSSTLLLIHLRHIPGSCELSAVAGDDSEFWIEGDILSVQKCAAGLYFNDTDGVCTCVRREGG